MQKQKFYIGRTLSKTSRMEKFGLMSNLISILILNIYMDLLTIITQYLSYAESRQKHH